MQSQLFTIIVVGAVIFAADMYLAGGFAAAFKKRPLRTQNIIKRLYVVFSLGLILATIACIYFKLPVGVRAGVLLMFKLPVVRAGVLLMFLYYVDHRCRSLRTAR
ncbi:hypothetical protein HK413_07380 [Mucilaginibacter sp. S1162]|uniref:DUF5658 domain-containing protein n=1 Tax=Mucilaginibacter humi TaxID=2732510 RepID=A0ABX1W609_9SPHI|nr:hypothetical protein [Mucilaginibacter humi]NNU34021.1 hypothetical protein [Mucilaginibacter humi]